MLIVAMSLSMLATACTPNDRTTTGDTVATNGTNSKIDLTGVGATLPYPLYALWFNEFAQRTHVNINYYSLGSGNGIARMLIGDVDFGATDVPMSDAELAQASAPIVHIPTIVGAVAITYNVPEIETTLQFSSDVIAGVFLGHITKWNDERIQALNPNVPLPASNIQVVHRADESGTSYIFTEYLSAVSPAWAAGPGRGKHVQWPTGVERIGNEGVAGQVKQTVGAIGYVEVVYARQNRLPVARLRNRAGRFVSPTPYEIASAAATMTNANSGESPATRDMRVSLVNAPGESAYPITSFTWVLISPQRSGPLKTAQMVRFLRWALTDGSDMASRAGYVPLPSVTASRIHALLDTLSVAVSGTDRKVKAKFDTKQ